MKLLFKQRLFSWFDSYDIYTESGETIFTVKGRLALGHLLEIYDRSGNHVGTVKEEVFRFLPEFNMFIGNAFIGKIKKEFTFFKPAFYLDCQGLSVQGDLFEWNYSVIDNHGYPIMHIEKQLFHLTDTYVIDVMDPDNALLSLMIVLSIDAAKCGED